MDFHELYHKYNKSSELTIFSCTSVRLHDLQSLSSLVLSCILRSVQHFLCDARCKIQPGSNGLLDVKSARIQGVQKDFQSFEKSL